MKITADVRQLNGLRAKFIRFESLFNSELDRAMDETGEDMLQTVRRHASGRPGPNVVTGQYVSSFRVSRPSRLEVSVTNDQPQAHRLEKGFYGTDSRGRVYNQQAYPHFQPMAQEVLPRFKKRLSDASVIAWRSS